MVSDADRVQPAVIAAFDFDGTMTVADTSLPFVLFVLGSSKYRRKVLPLAPIFGIDLLRAVGREGVCSGLGGPLGRIRGRWENNAHERILRRCFAGLSGEELRVHGEAFAQRGMDRFVRPASLDRLQWHKQQGHGCVLISASVDVYLEPWGKAVGFDHVIGTTLELDDEGVLTGRLASEPCWGGAKVDRLQSHLGSLEDYTVYAYGDSAGDRELLAVADHGFMVQGDFELVATG
jgi:HAD superfamily hydrolase (TIGR01490 family)